MGPRLRRIVGAPKDDIRVGPWTNGKVPRKDFPMAKQAYGLGNSYRWCVVSFVALGLECRVLIVLNRAKEKFEAILGAVGVSGMMHVLCSYEYHAGEPGWHCHAACDDLGKVPQGYMRGPWVRRLPGARRTHSSLDFTINSEAHAINSACEFYKIKAQGLLL